MAPQFSLTRNIRLRQPSFSCPSSAYRRSERSDRCGRFVRGRVHGIHRGAGGIKSRSAEAGSVLWWSDGIIHGGAFRHGAPAVAHQGRHRSTLSNLPRTYSPGMRNPAIRRWDRETALVAAVAACISITSFIFYFTHDAVLLYGDAVAHINIARRVFDSRTPGLSQLG